MQGVLIVSAVLAAIGMLVWIALLVWAAIEDGRDQDRHDRHLPGAG